MNSIRFLTAGESHGKGLVVVLDGMPAGLPVTGAEIDRDLARRQRGFGRGGRMAIENDKVEILSGVRKGYTLGSPLSLLIWNKDGDNWKEIMAVESDEISSIKKSGPNGLVTLPRPGHADLSASLKFGFKDIRNVIERASARETASRVAAGAVTRKLLRSFGINIYSRVVQIGSVVDDTEFFPPKGYPIIENSSLRCLSPRSETEMITLINRAQKKGDTLGGIFEVVVTGLPVGLGTYTQWDLRLDGRLARGLMSIPGIKGVEIGAGFKSSGLFGSQVQDEIFYSRPKGFYRKTNRAGGLEGGITNGENLILRAGMKPISTLGRPLSSVDLITKKSASAHKERSDICAVPAAGIVGEAMAALILADAFLDKFGGDSLEEIKYRYPK